MLTKYPKLPVILTGAWLALTGAVAHASVIYEFSGSGFSAQLTFDDPPPTNGPATGFSATFPDTSTFSLNDFTSVTTNAFFDIGAAGFNGSLIGAIGTRSGLSITASSNGAGIIGTIAITGECRDPNEQPTECPSFQGTFSLQSTLEVAEPASIALLGIGLLGGGVARARRQS